MSFDLSSIESLTQHALEIAHCAGKRIVQVYGGEYDVDIKSDNTPVTTADLAAHELIVTALSELKPSLPVLSEESTDVSFEERHRFAGVIVAPELGISYFAIRGEGAYKQVGDEAAEPIRVRSAPTQVTVAKSRSPVVGPRLQYFLDDLGKHDEIPMGSALKSCLVAEGAADVYARLGPTGEWDTGAAQCIVEEAGGFMQDINSRCLTYNERESLINPSFLVFGDDQVDWAQHLPPEGL